MGYLEIAKIGGLLLIVAAIFGGGYKVGYNFEHNKVLALEVAIEKANVESAAILAKATQKVVEAEKEAANKNEELENARTQEINTVNAYHDKLVSTRLFNGRSKTSCPDTLSKGSDTGINQGDETGGSNFFENLDRLLKSESLRADNCAVNHNMMLEFINNNCGIKE